LIAVYAIVNHQITAGRYVLWREGFRTYYKDGRTTGCYFCPDHFSGAMEILLGIALGVLGARRTGVRGRLAAVLSMILALYGILLSQSRGGALTVIVVVIAFLAIGLCEYRPRTRWLVRAGLAAAVAGAICVAVIAEVAVVKRMRAYPWDRIERDSRYQMAAAALRAWSETPATRVFGIGPGMHQNLWLHYAASNDGDRATGTWPRFRNMRAYSYEVHNDWLQLLEEYGVTGFLLFCVSVGGFVMLLMRGYLSQSRERRRADWSDGGGSDFQFMLASLLAIVAIGFHSLGDFNLQIPGTNWMFAALLSVSAGLVIRSR
jgi:O-antigen ligase